MPAEVCEYRPVSPGPLDASTAIHRLGADDCVVRLMLSLCHKRRRIAIGRLEGSIAQSIVLCHSADAGLVSR